MTDLKNKLLKMTRQELLGVWTDAQDSNDKLLEKLVQEVMAETQIVYTTMRQKRGFFSK